MASTYIADINICIPPNITHCKLTLKIEKVLEIRPYAITPPKDDNGCWQTYVNSGNGRKKIAKSSEKNLYQALIEHYLKMRTKILQYLNLA